MLDLLARPPDGLSPGTPWFDRIAAALLGGVVLVAGETRLRLLEVEVYLHSPAHPDPFVHRHPIQRQCGTWYLHRIGDTHRGGSFKGLDITFGAAGHGGVLIRTLRGGDGVSCGPSLCVDRLLAATGSASVAALDARLGGRSILDPDAPLHLVPITAPTPEIWRTPRVGLTLKRVGEHREQPRYIGRPYRYLTDPRAVRKGRANLILALHHEGLSVGRIRALTGSPTRVISAYIDDFEAGRALGDLTGWHGVALSTADFCQLYGAWMGRSWAVG
jgi:hypothetical protein